MKKITQNILFIVALMLFATEVMAQVPQGFNFQAVARNAEGELITSANLGVRISIVKGTESGEVVYTETQIPSTNEAGMFQLVIGEGTSENNFVGIDWSADNYFVKLEIDPAGGTEYEELGTTRLLSVPYALLAQDVVNEGSIVEEVELPLTLNGTSGNMSVTIGNYGVNEDYGFLELGNNSGNAMARMSVGHDSSGTTSQGMLRLDHTNGMNSRLYPHNIYFDYKDNPTNSPLAWFGTLGSHSGFSQILDFNTETNVYKGGILTGFWSGHPALLLEDGNEQPGIWLANDDGGGKLVMYSPDGGENIQMGGKSWEDSNLPFFYFRGNTNENGEQPDLVWMEAQKWEDGTELGVITLRGTDGSEFSINSHGFSDDAGSSTNVTAKNEAGDIVGSMNSFDPNLKQGFLHLYGETEPETNDLRAALQVNGNESGDYWGGLYLKGPAEDRNFVEASVSNDPGGEDPDGWSGQFSLWGTNSPNIEMRGKDWESSDLPQITLFGNKPNGNGWFYDHVNLSVGDDAGNQWGQLNLNANNGVPNFNLGSKPWEDAELPIFEMFGNQSNVDGWYYSNIVLEVGGDDGQNWGRIQLKGDSDKLNIEMGAKSWEDPEEGAGRPFMVFRGNTPDEDLIWMDVIDDGSNELGGINFRSTDGAEFSISAHGINSFTNINGGLHVDGDITHSGNLTQISDRSFKDNIEELENALDLVLKLTPTSYTFRQQEFQDFKLPVGKHFGLIAQEVEEILPELVQNNNKVMDDENSVMDYKTLNYTELIPILIKAVQEQQQQIEELKKQLESRN